MTGIGAWKTNILDSPEERFVKYKQISENYRIIQVGLTTFHKKEDGWEAKPFNFYVFPEENSGNRELNGETGAIIFNRSHKMDFNKWIYEGIPYVNERYQLKLMEKLGDSNINDYDPENGKQEVTFYSKSSKELYDTSFRKVLDFLCSKETSILLGDLRKFIIQEIMNNLSKDVRQKLYFDRVEKNWRISKVTPEERKERELKENEALKERIEDKLGFKLIWDALVKRRGVIVGHNFIFDLFFLLSHFGNDIPKDIKECKLLILETFGELYDTKVLFRKYALDTNLPLERGSFLEAVYKHMRDQYSAKIKISLGEGFEKYSEGSEAFHEAAFDAYICGAAFIWMRAFFGPDLVTVRNQVYWLRMFYHHIQLDGSDPFIYREVYS